MTILQAILLGLVQGLTEFIPVSSTAHLVFAARVVNLYGGVDKTLQAEQTTATIAVIQLGTLLAVLVYFARDIANILRAFTGDHLALMKGRAVDGQPKLSRDVAWLARHYRFRACGHCRFVIQRTDRRAVYEKLVGDRDDDGRGRRVDGDC